LLIRITWALVVVGFGLLVGGFLASDQNILLILAIFVELAAIILVLASWARRAKDAAEAYDDEDLEFEVSDDTAGDDDLLETFVDEEFAVGAREQSRKKAARRKPAARPAAKAGAKTAARKPATARKPAAKSSAKSSAKSGGRKPAGKRKPTAKAKPAARSKPTAKAKPAARSKPQARKPAKPKPQRRRPSSE